MRIAPRRGRARVVALVLALLGAARGAPAQDRAAVAQQRYARGLELFRGGSFADALAEFRASLELFGSPNTRLMEARTLRELGRLGEAMLEFGRAEREARDRASTDPRYEATAQAAHGEVERTAPRVAWLTLAMPRAPEGVTLRLNDAPLPAGVAGVPLPVTPGRLAVAAQAPGYAPWSTDVTASAGQRVRLEVALRPLPARVASPQSSSSSSSSSSSNVLAPSRRATVVAPSPVRAIGWTSVALGAASLVGFGVLAAVTDQHFHALMDRCQMTGTDGFCPESERPAFDTGHALEVATNATLVAGIALAAVGVVMVLAAPRGTTRPAAARARMRGVEIAF